MKKKIDGRARLEQARKKLMADFDDFPSTSVSTADRRPPLAATKKNSKQLTKSKARAKRHTSSKVAGVAKSPRAALVSMAGTVSSSSGQQQAKATEGGGSWVTRTLCFGSACYGQLGAGMMKTRTHCTAPESMELPTGTCNEELSVRSVSKRTRRTISREKSRQQQRQAPMNNDHAPAIVRPTSRNPTHVACGGNLTIMVMESGEVFSMGTGKRKSTPTS
jgi:hypothetical protein